MNELHWVKIDRNWFYRKVMSIKNDDDLCDFVRKFASHLFFGDGEIEEAKRILEEAEAKRSSYAERGRKGAEKRKEASLANSLANSSDDSLANSLALHRTEQNRTEQNNKIKHYSSSEEEQKKAVKGSPDNEFEEFWENYPSRIKENGLSYKGSKKKSMIEWKRLTAEQREQAKSKCKIYAQAQKGYTKDCERYLASNAWEGLEESRQQPKQQKPYCPPMAKPNKF